MHAHPWGGGAALNYIADPLLLLKQKFTNPYIVVTRDFNHWKIGDALLDFQDIKEAPTGPTRHDKSTVHHFH